MRNLIIVFLFSISDCCLNAQQNQFLIGGHVDRSVKKYITQSCKLSGTKLLTDSTKQIQAAFSVAQAVLYDSVNNTIAYTNGLAVYDSKNQIISRLLGTSVDSISSSSTGGIFRNQVLFIQDGTDHSIYYLLYSSISPDPYTFVKQKSLRYTSFKLNQSLIVLEENKLILDEDIASYEVLQNSKLKTWDIVVFPKLGNNYLVFQLDRSGVSLKNESKIPFTSDPNHCIPENISCHSYQHNLIATYNSICGFSLWQFDPCQHKLELMGRYKLGSDPFPGSDIIFSLDDRFIYISLSQRKLIRMDVSRVGIAAQAWTELDLPLGYNSEFFVSQSDSIILVSPPYRSKYYHAVKLHPYYKDSIIFQAKKYNLLDYQFRTKPNPSQYWNQLKIDNCDSLTIMDSDKLNEDFISFSSTSKLIRINNSTNHELKISLINELGQRIFNGRSPIGISELDARHFPTGVYFVECQYNNKQFLHKIILY